MAGVLERLVRAHMEQGDYQPAIDYARRWLRLDPLYEAAHRQLMRLYALTDRRAAALRQYQECARILEEELGISPSEETRALYEQIQTGGWELEGRMAGRLEGRSVELSQQPGHPAIQPSNLPPFQSSSHPAIQPSSHPSPHPPFIGRRQELARLGQSLAAALAGQGQVALVAGEAGSGKTALVHEFARRAQAATPDLVVAVGNCNAHTGLGDPYLPFREMLSLLAGDVEATWLPGAIDEENARRLASALPAARQILREVGPDLLGSFIPASVLAAPMPAPLASLAGGVAWGAARRAKRAETAAADLAQSDLFEQYSRLLQALARRQPLLLLMDDAQWADAASIGLLFHLSRRLPTSRILLVVTYRRDEVALGREGARHPLEPVVNELKRAYGEGEIDLDPAMGRDFIDALLDSQPNRLGESFRSALYRQTRGHPLFTVELLRAMQARGDLVRDAEGRWIEGRDLDWETLPARIEAVIEERIGRLDPELRELLGVASVEGEVFTAQVVARVQGLNERLLLHALSQELERRHHLVQAQAEVRVNGQFLSRYRFAHTMFQQYLYSAFSPGERRLLHGEIADTLQELYRGEEEITVHLARHYAEAGQVAQAVDYLLRAGDRARSLYAHQEAIDFYERALAFLKEEGAYERAARTLMKLGLTHHLAFDFPNARRAYQEGFALWQRTDGEQATPEPPAPHPFRLTWFDPPTLDPTLAGDDTSGIVIRQLFGGLLSLNDEMDVVPELAESWEVLEGGKRYIFRLRHDVRWSDGRLVTAADFVYAWRRTLNPALASPNASYLTDIIGARDYYLGRLADPAAIGVQARGESTLLVELEGPTGYFPLLLTQPVAFPVPRHVVEAHGPAWTAMEHLVTNGPFRLEDWQPGVSMRLVRNPDYRGPVGGNVQQVDLVLNPKQGDQLALYAADQLDMMSLFPFPSSEANWIRQRYAGEYFTGPALYTQYVAFDVRQPPFDDPRVRRALAMAIDKETLASVTLSGFSFPATGGFLPPEMPGHSPGIGLPYDPDQARRVLAEAGYPRGQGFPALEGLVTHLNRHLLRKLIAPQWREVLGIQVAWQGMDLGPLLERLDRQPPALFWMGWRTDYPDPDNPLRVSTHLRWTGWRNADYERLVEVARHTTDQAERLRLYQQADRLLVEDAAIIPMAYGRNHLVVKPWVRKFSASAINWPSWKDIVIEPHE
jgi:ABC-type oligopeptide transport system substrate-binding subunit